MTGAGGGSTPRAGAAAAGATAAVPAWGGGELLAAAAAEVAAACVSVALLWAPQERLVWQPPRVRARDLVPPAGATRLDFRAGDGQPLLAWAVEPAEGARPARAAGTLVAFHGNAELAAWGVPWARAVAERTGWRVVLPEYRGYAGLGGAPAYRHSAPDAWAAYEAVAARWGDAGRGAPLAVFGHSLGSAVAAELAAALAAAGRTPGTLLLQSPFTSIRAMARMHGWPGADALWARVARVHFDTAARVAELDAPVWVAHGAMDAVVPAWMGRRVWAAARRAGGLLVINGAGHNRVPERGGARYWRWIGDALAAPDPG
jgi:pimeloyl-ACP methyl ester carboxylesterase